LRRAAALLLGVVLCGCALRTAPSPPAGAAPAPQVGRVVLVTIDTLRADYVGAYGSTRARTPTLDALAGQGVRFETALAPTPITLPSHASLMTGLSPPLHGVHHNGTFSLPRGISTLAQHFRERGFRTAAFVGSAVLDRRYGLDYGFDHYDDHMDFRRTVPGTGGHAERRADAVVDAALAWLEEAPDRFFVWIHLYDPHASYDPPAPFRPRLAQGAASADAVGAISAQLYAGEVAFADHEAGRFLDAVRARHGADGLLVVAASDHGESLGEHGELTHTLGIYDATQRVPLLMAGPGLPAGRVVRAPVRLVDVAPTLIALGGLRPLPRTSGVDLSPWIHGERDDPLEAYLETLAPHLDFGWSPVYGVRTDRYKYLRTTRPELYDLDADPGERHDLAGERPSVAAELDAAITAHLEGARPLKRTLRISTDERARLEALGYVVNTGEAELPELGWVGGPDPKDRIEVVARVMQARSQRTSQSPEEALTALESVPEAAGWISQARAEAALAGGDFKAAEGHARQAARASPDRAEPYLALAQALEDQGRAPEAAQAYEQAAQLDPSSSDALAALGRLAEERGDPAGAADYYRRAAQAPTPSAEAALRLAALHFEQGQPSQARVLLHDAWSAPGLTTDVRLRAAWAEARAGYSTLALARLNRAIQQEPDNESLREAAAQIREQFGIAHFPSPPKPGGDSRPGG
jgi:arylsulfatase A-like enzyme/Tfp pilus assembly protein PilF